MTSAVPVVSASAASTLPRCATLCADPCQSSRMGTSKISGYILAPVDTGISTSIVMPIERERKQPAAERVSYSADT